MNIKENREKYFINQSELAAMIGGTQDLVSKWETGKVKPGNKSLRKLNAVFSDLEAGKSIHELMVGRKVKKK